MEIKVMKIIKDITALFQAAVLIKKMFNSLNENDKSQLLRESKAEFDF